MFKSNHLVEACRNLKLDPDKIGDNPLRNSRLASTFQKPFNLIEINFPEEELKEVIEIGKIIYNLISQMNYSFGYNLTSQEGKDQYERDNTIRQILPTLNKSLSFWLKQGLEKCESNKNFLAHNGIIYEVNPDFQKGVDEMNKAMDRIYTDFIQKQNASWNSIKDVILD